MVRSGGVDGGDGREEMEGGGGHGIGGEPLQSGEKAKQICIENRRKSRKKRGIYLIFLQDGGHDFF